MLEIIETPIGVCSSLILGEGGTIMASRLWVVDIIYRIFN